MEHLDVMLEPLQAFLRGAGVWLPLLVLAIAILIAGWLLAKATRFGVERGLRAINFHVLTERAGIDGFLRLGGIRADTTAIFAMLIYWVVILAALVIAFNTLGLAYVTDLLAQILKFVPNVIVALVVLAFGAYFARFVGTSVRTYCRNADIQEADLLARLAQYAILTFVVLIALDQVNVGGTLIRDSFLIILAGVVFALALAFGLGGQRWAARLLERWARQEDDHPPL